MRYSFDITDRYSADIPFLCFLANMHVSTRYVNLLQNSSSDITLENADFQPAVRRGCLPTDVEHFARSGCRDRDLEGA